MEVLKVSTKSNANSVAGAITALLKKQDRVELQLIGAGALNQAIKAVVIARGFVAPSGINLVCIPFFTEIEVETNVFKTGIKLIVRSWNMPL